jgi:hydroxypyruvate reductase
MSDTSVQAMRNHADEIFKAAVEAVDAEECVRAFVSRDGGSLRVDKTQYDLSNYDAVYIVGAGKASPRMAVPLVELLGDDLTGGVINTKYEHSEEIGIVKVVECGHPVPDEAGVGGTNDILEVLDAADERSLVICLLSGGGSAIMPAPVEGCSLVDKQETTRLLLECGANIVELNAIRKHLSRVKGGGLARTAFPATVVALMLSDVIGDSMDVIASGPTVPDTSTYKTCMDIFEKYEIFDQLPPAVRQRMQAGLAGQVEDTPKPGDAALGRVQNLVVGSNGLAVAAAEAKAKELGYSTLKLSTRLEGEAREIAHVHSAIAKEILSSGEPVKAPACVIAGGETTVTVRGKGKGGRNQEMVLAAALQLGGWGPIVFFSGGTDGTDGPTDAAGAVADGETIERAEALGLSPIAFLKDNNSYHFFKPLDDLVMTGPTGTNVADVAMVLVGKPD